MSKVVNISTYIEENYTQLRDRFTSFEWVKVYLEETVQAELELVDAFFSKVLSIFDPFGKLYKEDCVSTLTQTLRTQLNQRGRSKLLLSSELSTEPTKTDEQNVSISTLGRFLIPDLINIVIDYGFKIRFEVGMYIDILDTSDIWDAAKVKQILQYKNSTYLSVHYLEWTYRYDEFITVNSSRIRLFYDDNNQIVYNWARVDKHKVTQADCRQRGETKWIRRNMSDYHLRHKISLAPAGTFVKDNQ